MRQSIHNVQGEDRTKEQNFSGKGKGQFYNLNMPTGNLSKSDVNLSTSRIILHIQVSAPVMSL